SRPGARARGVRGSSLRSPSPHSRTRRHAGRRAPCRYHRPVRLRYRDGNQVRWQLEVRPWHFVVAIATATLVVAAGAWVFAPFWGLSGQFGGKLPDKRPSRLYGAPMVLRTGGAADLDAIVRELDRLAYRPATAPALFPGDYRRKGNDLAVYLRSFPTAEGMA